MFAYLLEIIVLVHHIILYLRDRALDAFSGSHEVVGRIDGYLFKVLYCCTVDRIYHFEAFYFVSEKYHSASIVSICEEYIDCVPLDTEVAAVKFYLISRIEGIYKLIKQLLTTYQVALVKGYGS